MLQLCSAAAAAIALLGCSCRASKLHPPVLPLIVRNPYLSTWLANAREEPWTKWPMFWTGQEVRLPMLSIPHEALSMTSGSL